MEVHRTESVWQEVGECGGQVKFAIQIGKMYFHAGRKFKHHLAADATGRPAIACDDGDGGEFAMAFADGFEERCPLGADCRREADALDIAAGVNLAASVSRAAPTRYSL